MHNVWAFFFLFSLHAIGPPWRECAFCLLPQMSIIYSTALSVHFYNLINQKVNFQ